MIKVTNAKIGYENKVVINVENFEFNVTDKKIIRGANGSGKTTFIKSFFKLSDLIDGDIIVNGSISYFPVEILFAKYLKVFEFLKISDIFEADKNSNYFLIEDFINHSINELSMGQTNRFLLFMTLAKKSDYYIIDELLNAIDSEKKLRILEVIKNQNGMLLISHDEGVIEYLMNDYQIFDV